MRAEILVLCLLPGGLLAKEVATSRYLHQQHMDGAVEITCDECHRVTPAMQPTFPGADNHMPCARCHAEEFSKRDSKLCLACHEHSEPWRTNPYRMSLRPQSEFHVAFSHSDHLGRGKKGNFFGEGCAACHYAEAGKPVLKRSEKNPAPKHAICSQCHVGKTRPSMRECASCHRLGAAPAPAAGAEQSWRVAAKFAHEKHRTDVRAKDAPLACEACHDGMASVDAGQPATQPAMADCAACHDGRHAFKVTGFDCGRCHGASPK